MMSLEWIKDYIDIEDQDLKELATTITKAGINIEKVITNQINNLTIGEITECYPHPNSDHLNICMVKLNDKEITKIVCGADNVRKGLKVIVALPGAILPGNIEIKKSKIRGEDSNGMICALYELGLEEKTQESYDRGIEELKDDAEIGADPIAYLGLDDTLYELDIHKHRNNDCYYHIGFAYEIGAILNREVKLPEISYKEIEDKVEKHLNLEVETEKCPYYLAKIVTNLEVKESPEFIKKRLKSAGMRPINNIVDISNYVMLEYGQPLHFFDKDKLKDNIKVRQAQEGEEVITLEDETKTLTSNDIVITDGKKPVAIAGIKGAKNTGVTDSTTEIVIESAIFDPISIRNTANRLNLKSDASIRFGKGLNYEYTKQALDRACHLLEKYAGGKVLQNELIHDTLDKTKKEVSFQKEDISKILGITITDEDMEIQLKRLGFDYTIKDKKINVTIPNRRLDIDPNVNDIAEEIGRLYGYQNLESTLPTAKIKKGEYKGDIKYQKQISKRLRTLGLNEVKTYTLVAPAMTEIFNYEDLQKITLPNPMSTDKSVIRTTLIPSLLNVYNYNKKRKVKDINIYEISKVYDKNYKEDIKVAGLLSGTYIENGWNFSKDVDFYILKGIIENTLTYMGFENRYNFEVSTSKDLHPGISADILLDHKPIGIMGKVHPKITKDEVYVFELSLTALMRKIKALKFIEAPKYPDITKDVAFIVNKDVTSKMLEKEIRKHGTKVLNEVKVFDIYEGDKIDKTKKSIAYSLVFNDYNKTLTLEEVDKIFREIIEKVKIKFNCEIRDK